MNELKVTGRVLPISDATRKRNPDLFKPMGRVETDRAEPDAVQALDGRVQKPKSRTAGVCCRVCCVAMRHRLLDQDAVDYSFKPLTDAIAAAIGIDDRDPRISWEYFQVQTKGKEGVIVTLQTV